MISYLVPVTQFIKGSFIADKLSVSRGQERAHDDLNQPF